MIYCVYKHNMHWQIWVFLLLKKVHAVMNWSYKIPHYQIVKVYRHRVHYTLLIYMEETMNVQSLQSYLEHEVVVQFSPLWPQRVLQQQTLVALYKKHRSRKNKHRKWILERISWHKKKVKPLFADEKTSLENEKKNSFLTSQGFYGLMILLTNLDLAHFWQHLLSFCLWKATKTDMKVQQQL